MNSSAEKIRRNKDKKVKRTLLKVIPALAIILALLSFSSAGRIWRTLAGGIASEKEEALVGFVCRETEPDDEELAAMIDELIYQTLGERGLSALCEKGDRVVIKVNLVGPQRGEYGEKGRAIISDPRVVRYVAEEVRDIIGWEEPADIIITDATFYTNRNPSLNGVDTSFYRARLERSGNNDVDPEDICYDRNGDGLLDGESGARLVNCDSWDMNRRFLTEVEEPTLGPVKVYLPEFLRSREQAGGDLPYCDVLIGIPLLKSHGFTGITGALKLSYGFKYYWPTAIEAGREQHSGYGWGTGDKQLLLDYLCAQQQARPYDFFIMDCLTGNRRGPLNISVSEIDKETDYIFTNALLASTDPVALDTVEALFCGYDPSSIKLLHTAALDGLGIDSIENIRLAGRENFASHKQFLYNRYGSMFGWRMASYPFYKGWGGAKLLKDFEAPSFVQCKLLPEGIIQYKIREQGLVHSGLSRIDILSGEEQILSIKKPSASGRIPLPEACRGEETLVLALWDNALNCRLVTLNGQD